MTKNRNRDMESLANQEATSLTSNRDRKPRRIRNQNRRPWQFTRRSVLQMMTGAVCAANAGASPSGSKDWSRWLVPQNWEKQKDGPVISLGEPGAFDDMHIFAPFVVFEKGLYSLLYPGSRGTVAERVFRLGLATSHDGIKFKKAPRG